jgi:hypothetical protein
MPQFETYDDGAFNVFTTYYGTYQAKTADGTGLCCGIDKEAVVFWAREHLNGFQNSYATVTSTKFTGQDTL